MVRMSSYPTTATSAPSRQALSATTWMYVATLALLAALSMATLTVANRLAAAALLLLAGAAALVFWPLVRRTRRYAEALLDAEVALHDQHERDTTLVGSLGAGQPAVNVGGNLTVLSEAPGIAVRPDPPASQPSYPLGPEVVTPAPLEDEPMQDGNSGQGADGERVLVPASLPGDGWSDTVARITYLQRPSRRGPAARTGR